MKPDNKSEPKLFSSGNVFPFVLVTALFLFWGIPNNLNDVLIKQFMKSFEINRFQAGLLQSAFYMGYFCLSMPAALLMRKYSYKTGLVTGLFLYSVGTMLFWPAALVGEYGFFLFALFVIASGLAFLETGANPFIAVLGDARTAARRLNFSQAFNPIGAITGVLVGTVFIFSGIELSQPEIEVMKAAGEYDELVQAGEPEYKQRNRDKNLVGAGGQETLRFEAKKAGQVRLELVYHRAWEKGAKPAETFGIDVTIR